ncbi:hypothetical protein KKG56_04020 [bacterium]|nr:hypothetical protein [bacterium]
MMPKSHFEPEIEVIRHGRTLNRHELSQAIKIIKENYNYLREEWNGYSGRTS